MKKLFFILLLIFQIFIFAQQPKYYIFQPGFEQGKNYFLEILTTESQINKKGKEIHPSVDFYKIKLEKKNVIDNEDHYSFQVLERYHNHTKEKKQIPQFNVLHGIIMNFKTDEYGKYLKLTNLENIKLQIKRNLTDKRIDSIAKRFSNQYIKNNYSSIRENPQSIIAQAEHQIITYFRYFGLKLKNGSETLALRYERFPFLSSESLPFNSTFNLMEKDDQFEFIIDSEVDKTKISENEYKSLAKCCSKSLEKFKANYHFCFKEKIIFSKNNVLTNQYTLDLKTSTHNADGGIWHLEKTYKLSQ